MIDNMERDQKMLLYQITSLYSEQFYINMNDHWTQADFEKDRSITKEIDRLENIYLSKYGVLPKLGNLITNVWKLKAELEREDDVVSNF